MLPLCAPDRTIPGALVPASECSRSMPRESSVLAKPSSVALDTASTFGMPCAAMSSPSWNPGALTAVIGSGATQTVIWTGKEMSRNTRPTIAGLKRLKPNPPKTCLARMVANSPPRTPIHHGAQGGREIASSQPVSRAEPSDKVGRTERPASLRHSASPNRAASTVMIHRKIDGQP